MDKYIDLLIGGGCLVSAACLLMGYNIAMVLVLICLFSLVIFTWLDRSDDT